MNCLMKGKKIDLLVASSIHCYMIVVSGLLSTRASLHHLKWAYIERLGLQSALARTQIKYALPTTYHVCTYYYNGCGKVTAVCRVCLMWHCRLPDWGRHCAVIGARVYYKRVVSIETSCINVFFLPCIQTTLGDVVSLPWFIYARELLLRM